PLRLQSGETITASDQGTGTQGRSQGTSSSGGVQTSGTSRGGSQQRGRGGRPKATGRVYTMTQQEAHASPDVITGTRAPVDPQEGPSKGPASSDQ
ncbi:unnamed protein product, partial [Prunus brigantina]